MKEKNAWKLFEATGTPEAYMIYARERARRRSGRGRKSIG